MKEHHRILPKGFPKIFTIAFFGSILFLLIILHSVNQWTYTRLKNSVDKELGEHLLSLAGGIGVYLSAEKFLRLSFGDEKVYNYLEKLWQNLREQKTVFNVFILDDSLSVLYNARSSYLEGSQDPSLDLERDKIILALSGIPSYSQTYRVGKDFLKRGYYPVSDPTGEILGVIGLSADASLFNNLKTLQQLFFWMDIGGILLIFAGGILLYFLIRNYVRMEKALIRAGVLSSIGQIASLLAHEIKNPLTIILGYAESLKKKAPESLVLYTESLVEEVKRLNRIAMKYLSLTKEKGEFQRVDVSILLDDLVQDLSGYIQEKRINIKTSFDRHSSIIQAEPELLRQAFLNILLNAIEVSPVNSNILLSTNIEKRNKPFLIVKVKDSGPGIPKKIRKKVTEPFFTTKEKGSGLGLFVVERVINRHKGFLEVSGAREGGTVISLAFPVKEQNV